VIVDGGGDDVIVCGACEFLVGRKPRLSM